MMNVQTRVTFDFEFILAKFKISARGKLRNRDLCILHLSQAGKLPIHKCCVMRCVNSTIFSDITIAEVISVVLKQ